MNIIETSHLSYDYIRHDEEGNVEGTTRAVSDVIKTGLYLIGVEAPERM